MRGMQCPRMLWLDKHHPELKVIPPEVQARLDAGNEFGDKAMGMFGPFVETTTYDVLGDADIDMFLYSDEYLSADDSYHFSHWLEQHFHYEEE